MEENWRACCRKSGEKMNPGAEGAGLAPVQCNPKRFAQLLREQADQLPHLVKLAWFLFVITIFAAMAISETANMDGGQLVLEATKSAIESAQWDDAHESVLTDIQSEDDIYTWINKALLPLLQSSQSSWYASGTYQVVPNDMYVDALRRKPKDDPTPDAGYPVWDARLGVYVLPAGSRVRKYNSAPALRLQQIRGERRICDKARFMDEKQQTALLGECFLASGDTTKSPDWDDIFKRGLRQELDTVKFLNKPNSSLVQGASALQTLFAASKIEAYAWASYDRGNCTDPDTALDSLPLRPHWVPCNKTGGTGGDMAPGPGKRALFSDEAECDARWEEEWVKMYTPTQRLFFANRSETSALASARAGCYALTKELLDNSVMQYFKLQSNVDEGAGAKMAGDAQVGLAYLMMDDDMASNIAVVDLLRKHSWIDVATRELKLTVPLFNANFQLFIVANIVFGFDTGGNLKVLPTYHVVNMQQTTIMALAYTCLAIVIFMIVIEVLSIVVIITHRARHPLQPRRRIREYFCFANFVDWLIIGLGFGAAKAYTTCDSFRTAFKFPEDMDVVTNPRALADSINDLEALAEFSQHFNSRMGLLLLVLCFKANSALSFHPRFGILCRQLERSAPDIAYFLVMFSFYFAGYAFFAHFLFGTHLRGYATMENAVVSTFNILLGSFDVQELHGVGVGLWAYAFFYTYNVLLLWILLNVFIAICADAYQSVKDEAAGRIASFHSTTMVLLPPRKLNKLADHFEALEVEALPPAHVVEELRRQGVHKWMISTVLINASAESSASSSSRTSVAAEIASTRRQLTQLIELQKDMAATIGVHAVGHSSVKLARTKVVL